MSDADLDRIVESLRTRRAELERDMEDTDRNINAAELLERIAALRARIERLQQTAPAQAGAPEKPLIAP